MTTSTANSRTLSKLLLMVIGLVCVSMDRASACSIPPPVPLPPIEGESAAQTAQRYEQAAKAEKAADQKRKALREQSLWNDAEAIYRGKVLRISKSGQWRQTVTYVPVASIHGETPPRQLHFEMYVGPSDCGYVRGPRRGQTAIIYAAKGGEEGPGWHALALEQPITIQDQRVVGDRYRAAPSDTAFAIRWDRSF